MTKNTLRDGARARGRVPPRARAAALPALLLASVGFPLLRGSTPFMLGLGVTACIWVILAVSYSVTFGLAGQFSVAHAALFGVGAYVTAILMTRWNLSFFATLPASVVAGACLGALVGLPAWRLSGDYMALVTLAGGVIAQQVMLNWTTVTGGFQGIANIPSVVLFGHIFTDRDYYLLSAAAALAVILVVARLKVSDLGRSWLAIREDELAAKAMGIRTARLKIMAFAVGGALAAIAGSIYAVFQTFVSSVSFGVTQSVQIILIVLLAGPGHVWGAAVAAVVWIVILIKLTTLARISLGLTGALMLAVMIIRGGTFSGAIGRAERRLLGAGVSQGEARSGPRRPSRPPGPRNPAGRRDESAS